MTTSTSTRERRDWTLLIFIIPIGIILMLIAGQIAIRLVPVWSIDAGMKSNLDPNELPNQQSGLVQPVLPAILTPLGWFDTFLTPSVGDDDDVVFPPFIIFEPTIVNPTATNTPPQTLVPTTPPPTLPVTISPTTAVTPTPTSTKKPTSPTSTNTPVPTNTPAPTPTPTTVPVTSTLPPFPPIPPAIPVDIGPTAVPDGTLSQLLPGTYTVINLGVNGVVVSNTPDGNYDLILYESLLTPGEIALDEIIVLISQDGITYYEVFEWGDTNPDTNTNLDPTLPENDNAVIQTADLYDADGDLTTPPDNDLTTPQTGILIDVDTAPDNPPEGTYNYIAIISPSGGDSDSAQVDAIVIDEVPIASTTAPIAPPNNVPVQVEDKAPDPPANDPPDSPENDDPAPPADGPPALP